MYENIQTIEKKKDESIDAAKKFTNIDTEDFEFSWDGKPSK